jgi:hypothetical protein
MKPNRTRTYRAERDIVPIGNGKKGHHGNASFAGTVYSLSD